MNLDVLASALPAALWLPIVVAAVVLGFRRNREIQRLLSISLHVLMLGAAIWALITVSDGTVVVEQVSAWPAGISIPFVLDTFAALMVGVAALMVLVCTIFAITTDDDADPYFHPLVLVLAAGVYGAFLTGDLFNLFVMIEVALIPSYVLLTRSGSTDAIAAGRIYFTVNLLVSAVLLCGVGFVYGTTGTVNLGELTGAAHESSAAAVALGVVLLALAAKAAVVPVHLWLPRSYPFSSVAVTALLSGLLTKIGVYGVFRVYSVGYEGTGLEMVWLVVLILTMVVGVLGALGESSMRSILSFHMTSQVGYIMLPLAFFGPLGMAAAVFYMIHHIIVKAALFLLCGAVEHHAGTGKLAQLGGYARREPWLGVAFIVAALSLVGIPPLSGFVAKFGLIRASLDAGVYVAAAAAVIVSLFTLLSMLKIWNGAFWGSDPEPADLAPPAAQFATSSDHTDPSAGRLRRKFAQAPAPTLGRLPARLVVPGAVLAVCSLSIGLGADVLWTLASTAAEQLADPTVYQEAVMSQ